MVVSLLGAWITQESTTPSHTIESGSNRLFVICIGMSSLSFPNEIASVTMGGQSLTKLVGAELIATISTSASIWYANETMIAAMSDGNMTMTAAGTPGTVLVDHAFFGGVDQTTPWNDSDSATAASATNLSPPAIDTVNDGLLIASAAANGSAGTTTWTNVTEISDSLSAGSPSARLSSATDATTGISMTVTATKSVSASRLIVVAGSLQPVSAPPAAFAYPLALLGVGRAA